MRVIVWSVLTGLALALPGLCLTLVIPVPAPDAVASARAAQVYLAPSVIVLKALIILPLIEEFFYRGLLLQTLRRRLPLWFAVLVPTILFAATHLGSGLRNALFALVAGGYFAWLALRSRSLYPSILCHVAANLSGLFVLGPILVAHGIAAPDAMVRPLPLALLAGSLVVFGAGLRILDAEFSRAAPVAAAGTKSSLTFPPAFAHHA